MHVRIGWNHIRGCITRLPSDLVKPGFDCRLTPLQHTWLTLSPSVKMLVKERSLFVRVWLLQIHLRWHRALR